MASVEFSDSYRIAIFGYPDNYVRVDFTEVEYDAANNRTKVRLDGVYIKYTGANANCRCYGTLKFNGTTVLTLSGSSYVTIGQSYSYVPDSATGNTVWVQHSSPSGTASLPVSLTDGTRNDDNDKVFGALYYNGSGYPVIGVRTPETKNVSLTTRTTTLTVNPNGGTWNGSTASQNFSQAPTSTKAIANPTRTGYTFNGWALTGGGSLSGTTYTYGGSNGTLTAQWTINTYPVSFDANGGEGAPEAQTKTYGQTLVLSDVVPTRTGYTFRGWATTSDASVPQYQPSGNYTANAAATLYAVWQINAYSLSITKSEAGLILNVTRTESPIAGADTGILANGATVYYGDKLVVAYTLSAGYAIDTATINGVDMSSASETVTVSSNMVVIVLVELQALAYIDNGASIDMYQIYIDDGVSFEPYQAYIDNGVSWDVY